MEHLKLTFNFSQAGSFQQGDVVRVNNDIALVHTLQEDHGGWVDDMVLVGDEMGVPLKENLVIQCYV